MSVFYYLFFLIVIKCQVKENSINNNNKRDLQSDQFTNIRLYIDTDCLTTNSQNNTDATLIKQGIERAKTTIEKLIMVKRISQTIDLRDYSFPTEFSCSRSLNYIQSADLAIIVRYKEQNENLDFAKPNILYYTQDENKRPYVGTIVYNNILYDISTNDEKVEAISIIFLHEITHILGFQKEILQQKYLIKTIPNHSSRMNDWFKQTKLYAIGPKVMDIAKKYFGCQNLEGVELDDTGGKEDMIHWNARILLGDYMTTDIYYPEQAISEITLALLEDLGWYKVNYYTGGLMRFGKNKGCSTFFDEDCVYEVNHYTVSNYKNEFCTKKYTYNSNRNFGSCSPGRQSMSYCLNTNDNSLFNGDSNYARGDNNDEIVQGYSYIKLVEYCPISFDNANMETDAYHRIYYGGNCKYSRGKYGSYLTFWKGTNNENKYYSFISDILEDNYSYQSFCAFSSLTNKNYNFNNNNNYIKGILRPTCYEMSCSESSLTIKVGSEYIVCPREGGALKINSNYSNYTGILICPDYNLICTGSVICNNIFDCVDKGSIAKISSFNYNYEQNAEVSIDIKNNSDSSITNYISEGIYELGNDGVCPKDCQQCTGNGQCTVCRDNFKYYVGVAENDNNTINCTDEKPTIGYYNVTIQGKEYFFKCIENCDLCFSQNKTVCTQCAPTHYVNETDGKCEIRIPGCVDYDIDKKRSDPRNGGAESYYECLNCNNSDNYYCFDLKKDTCQNMKINKSLYYDMEEKNYPCIQKCEDKFMNCESCIFEKCTVCNQTKHFINDFGNCIQEIPNCYRHDLTLNYSSCRICDEENNYYCINDTRSQCFEISDISSYFRTSVNEESCFKLCSENFTDKCLECNYTGCTKCIEGYLVYNGQCIQNLEGCINNTVISLSPELKLECDECDKKNNYYCINETKTVCNSMEQTAISAYYLIPNISYPCYRLCGEKFPFCNECNTTNCLSCLPPYAINRQKTICLIPPNFFREDVKCEINMNDLDNINQDYDFQPLVKEYFKGLDHISKVKHYIGNDFTMTFYINSNCTDGLLQKGFYSIDTRELNKTIIEESEFDFNFHLLGIYVNRNYRSYLSFYDLEGTIVDPKTKCSTCSGVKYIMTHNLYNILNEVIGTPFTELVFERELNMFDKNDDIYTDRCTNFSLFKIDIPIHLRKNYLLIDEFIDPLLCRDMDCELIEYNMTNRTTICQCPLQTEFNYLFGENNIKFTLNSEIQKAEGIAEAAKAITCMRKGIKYSNFKNNDAAIVILIFFIVQIACYVGYGCFGKPLVNVSNLPTTIPLANPPKLEDNFKIYLFADWNMNLSNSTKKEEPQDEEEKVIQPRDDSGDQIMEEEKSLNNDFFSDNNISIDTNAGGLFQEGRTNRSLRALEKSKKVMILLGNRLKKNKKVSVEQSIHQNEIISDDDEPLSENEKEGSGKFLKNYWLFLSIKQHIINYFSEITCCKITISYVPLELRFVRSIFLFILSIVITILWLDQKYFEKKWEHFNDKYSLSSTFQKNFEISLVERISYALVNNIGNSIVNLIFLIVGDFIVGAIFFNLRNDVQKLVKKNKVNKVDKMQDYLLKVRRNYNIFYVLNFILIIVFFLSLCGFGVIYPGGIADCLTVAIFSIFLLEIVPFIWALILATFRYFGYKKKKQALISFSEFFLF